MFKFTRAGSLFVVLAFLLGACGGRNTPAVRGDATRGKSLYEQMTIGPNAAPGCVTCHSLEPGVRLVGPSHAGLATRAAETIESPNYTGQADTAAGYLRESIVEPNAYIEEGFTANVMYPKYKEDLSEQDIDDLVAFILTLK